MQFSFCLHLMAPIFCHGDIQLSQAHWALRSLLPRNLSLWKTMKGRFSKSGVHFSTSPPNPNDGQMAKESWIVGLRKPANCNHVMGKEDNWVGDAVPLSTIGEQVFCISYFSNPIHKLWDNDSNLKAGEVVPLLTSKQSEHVLLYQIFITSFPCHLELWLG